MIQHTEVISHSPSTGAEIGRYPNSSEATINELVAQATVASEQWRLLGFRGRKIILKLWAHYLAEHIDELSQLVALETGKIGRAHV